MRTVLGVSVGSATARGVAVDAIDESVRSAHIVHSFDPGDHLQVALDLLDSMSRDQMVERADIVLAVPDDPGARGRTSAYSTYEADRLLVASELGAQLRYLRGSGQLEGARTVAICDIGASGTTMSIADPASGRVFSSVRTTLFGGIGCDEQISRYLLSTFGADELASDHARADLMVAIRTAREQLSRLRVAEVAGPFVGGPVRLWRNTFDDVLERSIGSLEDWVASVIVDAPCAVNALVMVGGCANLPSLRRLFRRDLMLPVIAPANPESLTAHGAALMAVDAVASRQHHPRGAMSRAGGLSASDGMVGVVGYNDAARHRSA
ncbi:Hsp70 family protein [Rhodococcus sp. IEGM 1381]|uniref:Hsp70 family protein n=1 Tax=Rhodococcus sp. IEGM 1381 TaxID=3047085 RepID=UPI0024B79446|nr:Hsp70 family protein [Rhodococcus sp. IEGM 1381]MDI9894131.1 Hsp70 family protein [Rhodococcus sp. IEGM 1381]